MTPPLDIAKAAEVIGVSRRSLDGFLARHRGRKLYERRGAKRVFYPEHIREIKALIAEAPPATGEPVADQKPTALYRFFGVNDLLLYVGVSRSAAARLSEHKGREWDALTARIDVEWFATRDLALEAEKKAIRAEIPAFNKAHNAKPVW